MDPFITSIQFRSEHTRNYRHTFGQSGAEVVGAGDDDPDAEFLAMSFACQRLDLGIEVGVVIDGHN